MKVSLIVATYNRPDALAVYLDGVRHQTRLPDEIIIGDDGSKEETKILIDEISKDFPVPIIHLWQEDNGFRKSMMRNKCVAQAKGEYIIETDGDIFMHPMCIHDHLRLAEKGYYVKGGRVNLGKNLSEKICQSRQSRKIYPWTKGIESKPENAFQLNIISLYLASRYRRNASPALGANMSYWREDYIKINGYDEYFEGWGGEDVDLGNRFLLSGLKKRYLKFAGLVYHLWHEDKHMYNKEQNFKYMKEQKTEKIIRCKHGIDQYL